MINIFVKQNKNFPLGGSACRHQRRTRHQKLHQRPQYQHIRAISTFFHFQSRDSQLSESCGPLNSTTATLLLRRPSLPTDPQSWPNPRKERNISVRVEVIASGSFSLCRALGRLCGHIFIPHRITKACYNQHGSMRGVKVASC